MQTGIGKRMWVIADGYIPGSSTGPEPEMLSHESFCVLNTNGRAANIKVTIYHEDRDPVGPYRVEVPAQRTKHVRFNDLSDPEPIPRGRGYAALIESNLPIVVQHTRLDSRQAENGLFSTIAWSSTE